MSFCRFCVYCRGTVPEDRLRRGGVTCTPECKRMDRKEQRRQQKLWRLEGIRYSATKKRLVYGQRRSAPRLSDSEVGVAQAVINHSEQEH